MQARRGFLAIWAGIALLVLAVAPAIADADADYLALMAAAKADPNFIDYRALRAAYAASHFYKGYASDPAILRVPNSNASEAEVRKFVDNNFPIMGTPGLAFSKLKPAPGSPEADFYRKASGKLFEVIATSGNGKSAATAFKVLAVSEEYDLCATLGVKVLRQRVVNQDGRVYDVLEVTFPDGQGPVPIWFDASPFFGTELAK
jgi:Domain of unknown function (DUF4919)